MTTSSIFLWGPRVTEWEFWGWLTPPSGSGEDRCCVNKIWASSSPLGLGAALDSDNFKSGRHSRTLTCLVTRVTPGGPSVQSSLLGLSQINGINFRTWDPSFCSHRALCVCARDASLLYLKAVCEEGRTGLGVSWDHILFCPLLSVAAQDF